VAQPPLLTQEGNSDSRFASTTYLRTKREVADIGAIAMDIIVATAMTMGAPLLSSDKRILKYAHVKTIWK